MDGSCSVSYHVDDGSLAETLDPQFPASAEDIMCLVDAVYRADSRPFLHTGIRNCLEAVNILQMDSDDSENSHCHQPSTRPHCLPAASDIGNEGQLLIHTKPQSGPVYSTKRGLFSRSWPRMTPNSRDQWSLQLANV